MASDKSTALKVYPRGFLGKTLSGKIYRPDDTRQKMHHLPFMERPIIVDRNDVQYGHPDVENLFNQMVTNKGVRNDPQFHIDVMKVWSKIFVLDNIEEWVKTSHEAIGMTDGNIRIVDLILNWSKVYSYKTALVHLTSYATTNVPPALDAPQVFTIDARLFDYAKENNVRTFAQLATWLLERNDTGVGGCEMHLVILQALFGSIAK